MPRRRQFVPEGPINAILEDRLAPSTLGSIGDWFASQYSHVKQDLGISPKPPKNAAEGIEQLWKESPTLSKPTHTAHHAAKTR